jgi:hypothetical protein
VAVYTVLTLVRRLHPVGHGRNGAAAGSDAAGGNGSAGGAAEVLVTEQPGTAPARMN